MGQLVEVRVLSTAPANVLILRHVIVTFRGGSDVLSAGNLLDLRDIRPAIRYKGATLTFEVGRIPGHADSIRRP